MLSAMSFPIAGWWATLQREVLQDPFYNQFDGIAQPSGPSQCSKHYGVWFHRGKIMLSPNSSLIPTILTESHSQPPEIILDITKPLVRSRHPSDGPVTQRQLKLSPENNVNDACTSANNPRESYNLYQFQPRYGRISLWILSKVFCYPTKNQ